MTAETWRNYIIGTWEPLDSATTDEEIAQYARNYSTTYVKALDQSLPYPLTISTEYSVFHAVGTAAMSRRGDSWGVLDPDLRVKGTKGLRVVDASAFPYVPTAHSESYLDYNAPVFDCHE